jgi:hypothetical protein
MFEHWGEFYLVAGGAAAVLIGLIFVVVTLMNDRPRSSVLAGSRLYMGPIVLGLSFVLALSAVALTPEISNQEMAVVSAVIAIWGLFRGLMSVQGIHALKEEVHWSDVWFYGVIPSALFLALGGVAYGFGIDQEWAVHGVAAVVTGLVLLAVRNEWDLVTWLAPKADADGPEDESIASS